MKLALRVSHICQNWYKRSQTIYQNILMVYAIYENVGRNEYLKINKYLTITHQHAMVDGSIYQKTNHVKQTLPTLQWNTI